MRRVFWLLVVAALVVAATWWLAGLPGEVTLHVANYGIASRTPIALVAGVLLVLLIYAVLRLLGGLLHLPRRWRIWRAGRNRAAGDLATSQTLVALAAGNGAAARKAAHRALRLLGETPQTLLHAAEAARLAGREDEAADWFRKLAVHDQGAFLGLRGLFRQAVARQAWDEATILLSQAEAWQPGQGWLRDTRLMLAARQGDWRAAAALAEPGPAQAALAIAASEATSSPDEALRLAKQAWTDAKALAPAALAYAGCLRTSGHERKAIDAIRETWAQAPHPDLVEFVVAPGADAIAKLKLFTAFIQPRASHPEAQFALARLSLDAGALGDASYHLEAAEHGGLADRRIGLLRADIARANHQPDAERAALRAATLASLPPRWKCAACGADQDAWHPSCETCHAVGQIAWGQTSGLLRLT